MARSASAYRGGMEIVDNRMEAVMSAATISDTAPRYGFAPQAAFATTRAGAERRARERAAAAALVNSQSRSARHLIHSLATRVTALHS